MKYYLPLFLVLATSLSAVPSDINYQGRLTDANGDAVTGDVTMSVKMYDAQSGGNEIYSEDIGTVTLDENGVYSFQFGASGNSTVTKTETIVTSDGTSTDYTGTFISTPIDGTISVTDGTYSWNDIDGNPGEQATAYIIIINGFVIYADIENGGSGYDDYNPPLVTITGDGTGATATATVENGVVIGIDLPNAGNGYTEGDITIAPPPAPFKVDKVDGSLQVGYAVAPAVQTGVVATYKTLEPSIIGALSEASSHWLELTVDGTRARILSVPFAQVAGTLKSNNKSNESILRFANSSIEIGADEIIEINDLYSDGNDTAHCKINVIGKGKTISLYEGLQLPIMIPGPSTVEIETLPNNDSKWFTYRILKNTVSLNSTATSPLVENNDIVIKTDGLAFAQNKVNINNFEQKGEDIMLRIDANLDTGYVSAAFSKNLGTNWTSVSNGEGFFDISGIVLNVFSDSNYSWGDDSTNTGDFIRIESIVLTDRSSASSSAFIKNEFNEDQGTNLNDVTNSGIINGGWNFGGPKVFNGLLNIGYTSFWRWTAVNRSNSTFRKFYINSGEELTSGYISLIIHIKDYDLSHSWDSDYNSDNTSKPEKGLKVGLFNNNNNGPTISFMTENKSN